MFSTQWGGGQCVHERSVCKWAKCKRHKSASHTKLRLTKHMSKHWAQKAKCILDAWLVCFHCYIREQAFGCSTQKAYYCAHNKAEDKLLWTWQLNDSSTVRLEENCLVKVFTEITSNDSCKKKTKQRKQWTMVLTNPVELYDKCAYYLSYVYLWGMCAFMELMWNDIWWRINTLLLLKYFIDPLWQTVIWKAKHRWLSYYGAYVSRHNCMFPMQSPMHDTNCANISCGQFILFPPHMGTYWCVYIQPSHLWKSSFNYSINR